MNPVAAITTELDSADNVLGRAVWVWCPGCDQTHRFNVESVNPERISWWWDGDLELPSFEPSLLTWGKNVGASGEPEDWRCHSFLRKGVWDFLDDSTHALAGQKVPMVPVPDWLVNP